MKNAIRITRIIRNTITKFTPTLKQTMAAFGLAAAVTISPHCHAQDFTVDGAGTRAGLELVPAAGDNPNGRIVAENGLNTLSLEGRGSSTAFQQLFRSSLDAPEDSLTIQPSGLVSVGTQFSNPDPFSSPIVRLRVPGLIHFDEGFPGDRQWLVGNAFGFFTFNDVETEATPFSIEANAPHNSFFINDIGDVGVGTQSADASLHVLRDDGSAQVLVEEISATPGNRSLMELRNNGGVRFSLDNSDASEIWEFTNNTVGNFIINRLGSTSPDGTRGPEFQVRRDGSFQAGPGGFRSLLCQANGNLFIAGSLTEMSDRNSKENYENIDCQEILAKVAELPLTTWNYKSDEEDVRHIGPVAQDFRAAFGLGHNATTISTSDKVGVNMAAIKALKNAIDTKDQLIEDQRLEIEAQKATLEELQARMDKIEAALQ